MYDGILDSIVALASALKKVSFHYVSNQANSIAWVLAKTGLNISDKAACACFTVLFCLFVLPVFSGFALLWLPI
ncbi:hypothetical protein Ddye_005901 [Dipteronia dyeriana]|uniref:Uncharacterized protein n=1 Tax=Dipteronia dyeriana TaxID=168575 RepID=A0AAE0CQN9_9ROSI|nr:hypothetical protein Ddye_005901 [Dipteronia dyeriana]